MEHQKKSIISGSDVLILKEREIEIDKFLFVHATLLDNHYQSKENRSTHESIYKIFGLMRQGYHAWIKRKSIKTKAQQEKEALLKEQQTMFKEIIKRLGFVPGKRTFHLESWCIFNHEISVKRAQKVMRSMNLETKNRNKIPIKIKQSINMSAVLIKIM